MKEKETAEVMGQQGLFGKFDAPRISTPFFEPIGQEEPVKEEDEHKVIEKKLGRKVFVTGSIGWGNQYLFERLFVLAKEDKKKPVTMYIDSYGGSVDSMFAIIDMMDIMPYPIYTVCIGTAMSAAAVILANGDKGHREAFVNSRMMIHQLSSWQWGKFSDIENETKELRRLHEKIVTKLAQLTGQDKGKIKKDFEKDFYMGAEAAKAYGLIDSIVKEQNLEESVQEAHDYFKEQDALRLRDIVVGEAVWTGTFINRLPDSAFLYIATGGKKDATGRTKPRSLRYFPYKDAAGKVDRPHVTNAIARIPQAKMPDGKKFSDALVSKLQNKARKILQGIKKAESVEPQEEERKTAEHMLEAEYRYYCSGCDCDRLVAASDMIEGSTNYKPMVDCPDCKEKMVLFRIERLTPKAKTEKKEEAVNKKEADKPETALECLTNHYGFNEAEGLIKELGLEQAVEKLTKKSEPKEPEEPKPAEENPEKESKESAAIESKVTYKDAKGNKITEREVTEGATREFDTGNMQDMRDVIYLTEAVFDDETQTADVTLFTAGLSVNKNYYSAKLLEASPQIFDGLKAYKDHKDLGKYGRSIDDLVGDYGNTKYDPIAKALKSKLEFVDEELYAKAKKAPHLYGLSPTARVRQRRGETPDGTQAWITEEFVKAHSVDIVTEPAAGGKIDRI